MKEKHDHYVTSVIALMHAANTALRCVPDRYSGKLKQWTNVVFNAHRNFESEMNRHLKSINPDTVTIYEDTSAFYTEILEEASIAYDKRLELLALVKAFNKGEVLIQTETGEIKSLT